MTNIPVTAYVVAFNRVGSRAPRFTRRQLQLHYRWRFIEALRGVRYYRNIVDAELRPSWRKMSPDQREVINIHDLPSDSTYVQEVALLVGTRMNCQSAGVPAPWLMQAVHFDVIGNRMFPVDGLEPVRAVRGHLNVSANTVGMGEVLAVIHSQEGGEAVGQPRTIPSQPYAAFDDWDELRRAAHAALDDLIDSIRQNYIDATSHFQEIRPSKLEQLRSSNMRQLIAWLWPEMGARSVMKRDTRRRLLDDLGLDKTSRAKTKK